MPCGGRLSRTSASGQGHTGFRGRQTGQTSARIEARGRHEIISGHLVVLGELVPPLDLATGQARVPLPGHAVVTGAALHLLAAATRAPAAIFTLNNIKTALYAAHNKQRTRCLRTMRSGSATAPRGQSRVPGLRPPSPWPGSIALSSCRLRGHNTQPQAVMSEVWLELEPEQFAGDPSLGLTPAAAANSRAHCRYYQHLTDNRDARRCGCGVSF